MSTGVGLEVDVGVFALLTLVIGLDDRFSFEEALHLRRMYGDVLSLIFGNILCVDQRLCFFRYLRKMVGTGRRGRICMATGYVIKAAHYSGESFIIYRILSVELVRSTKRTHAESGCADHVCG